VRKFGGVLLVLLQKTLNEYVFFFLGTKIIFRPKVPKVFNFE
jgi:hypothetical protein